MSARTPTQHSCRNSVVPPADNDGSAGNNTRLLKSRAAAEVLNVSERTLWSLDKSGEIPRINIGRAVRYDTADLYAWIERQKR